MRRFSVSRWRILPLPPQLVPLLPPPLGQSRILPGLAPYIIVISVEKLDTPWIGAGSLLLLKERQDGRLRDRG
jgi:hypothetical protein